MKKNNGLILPLSDVRVVDWTIQQTGPSASQLLASMGAEVIKLESPAGGDPSRSGLRDAGGSPILPHGLPYVFENNNRDKKGIAIDLTKEEGKQIIYSLVAKSNLFMQNFRPGVAQRLNMDYDTLKKYNPSLVYANCSGFGPKGKQASQTSMDKVGHAVSGMMLGIGEPGMPPIHVQGAMSDQTTALMFAFSIVTALFCQEHTGVGQELHVSMLGSMIWLQTNNILYTLHRKKSRARHSRTKAANPLNNHYGCKDGRWIQLNLARSDRFWPALCRVLGLEELRDDPRFRDSHAREQNCVELVSILDRVFATKARDEWLDIFSSEDLVYSPIKDYWEVVNDPQVLENEYIVEFDHPTIGRLKEIGIPVKFNKAPRSIRQPAPQLGQHTEEVLINILGYSRQEIEGFRDRKVIL